MRKIPREVRKSPITWSKGIRRLQESLSLNGVQKAVLIGTLLGDGSLIANAHGKNYRLQIEHMEKHKDYVDWKYQVFKKYCLGKPKLQERTNSWKFRTISHPIFTKFHELFYRQRKKIIPRMIVRWLRDPLSLAVWFMDDGGLHTHKKTITISTHCFSRKENEALRRTVRKNFGIETNCNWDGKGSRLYIPVREIKSFIGLISPYILPVMRYKVP